jgi:hypothetical protein
LRWFRFKLQLCAAVLVAALGTNVTDPAAYRRVWRALSLWWGATDPGARVSPEVYAKRLETCKNCPLFFKPLQTCGSPLTRNSDLGCWCFMPAAAKLADKGCWIDEYSQDANFGWKNAGL